MFEDLIHLDQQLLVFLNNLGTEQWDPFWLFVTDKFKWMPVYLLLLFTVFKYLGWRKGGVLLLIVALMITFSDQFTNFIRGIFERDRPFRNLDLATHLRTLIRPGRYSFTSGHATTSTAVTVFLIASLRTFSKYIYLLIIFPILFAYSRLYLGVHFPSDVTMGACIGGTIGYLFYKIYAKISLKIFAS